MNHENVIDAEFTPVVTKTPVQSVSPKRPTGWLSRLNARIEAWLDRASTLALTATPEARATIYAQLALAEGQNGGEIRLFDHLLAAVDDPQLRKIIQRHRADEDRHEQMYLECVRRTGVDPGVLPPEMSVLLTLDKRVGILTEDVKTPEQIMRAYLLLLVVEERAVTQFELMESVFRVTDPFAADTVHAIARDEARHIKYCHAVSKKYAPSEEVRQAELKRLRELEAEAFAEVELANLEYALKHDQIPGFFRRLFWKGMYWIGKREARKPFTYFYYGETSATSAAA